MAALLLLVAFVIAWAWLAQQHAALWQRLPASAVERYVPDQLTAALPAPLPWRALQTVCATQPSRGQHLLRGAERRRLAACLADPAAWVDGDDAEQAAERFEAALRTRLQAAEQWLLAWDAQADVQRAALQAALQAAQARPAGALQPLVDGPTRWGRGAAGAVASASATAASSDTPLPGADAAAPLRRAVARAQAQLASPAEQPDAQRAVALGMAAAGLQLMQDYGHAPPRAVLVHDRGSLAATLERQRRAQRLAAQGGGLEALAALQAVPAGVLVSGAVLLLAGLALSAAGRAPRWTALAWAAVSVLLGLGVLLLTDLALTGDPAMRHLAGRQFVVFGLGDIAVPLLWRPAPGVAVFWPLLLTALALGACASVHAGESRWLAPIRAWVRASADPRRAAWPAAALLLAAVAWLIVPGMSAAASEALLAIGALGLASYAARQSALAATGGGLQGYNLGIVAVAATAAVGGALLRADLGHALVALALLALFAALFAGGMLRATLALGALVGIVFVMASWWAGAWLGPFAWLTGEALPPHAQQRMLATFDPFQAEASDLARVRWLMASAGREGWGPGSVPWLGLDPSLWRDGLPLQGPSDYVLAMLTAMWGHPRGLLLGGAVLLLFGAAMVLGLRTAARPGVPVAVRALAAFGGFGCGTMALRVLLSMGGVTGTLPLTGVPVALLGYGPVTHAAALMYLVLALGLSAVRSPEVARGVHLRPREVAEAGPAQRARGWGWAGGAGATLLLTAGVVIVARAPAKELHVAQSRLEWASAITQALRKADSGAEPLASPVAELADCVPATVALRAWDQRLRELPAAGTGARSAAAEPQRLRLDAQALLQAQPLAAAGGCVRWARVVGQMLQSDLTRIVGRANAWPQPDDGGAPKTLHARLATLAPQRAFGVRASDYETDNAWWGLPGCVAVVDQPCGDPARWAQLAWAQAMPLDPWLQQVVVPALRQATRQQTGYAQRDGRRVPQGPSLRLTLEPALQRLAQAVADCFVGDGDTESCAPASPAQPAWRERYLGTPQRMRAGALGLVMIEVDSGRVVAMAGSVSDCTALHLAREAEPDSRGRAPALRDGHDCAQFPDRRLMWLAQQHPALWMLPPGSTLKPLALAAGVDAGLVRRGEADRWRRVLAESRLRLPVQQLALDAGPRYIQVLQGAGFDRPADDLLWGRPDGRGWALQHSQGAGELRPPSMSLAQAERIRSEKAAGVNVDRRHGPEVMHEFLAARRLADAAVGGADVRVNAWGLAVLWQQLALRADGAQQAPRPHLAEGLGEVAQQPLDWLSPAAARQVMAASAGVTASAWGGTAQGSCRLAFGQCPPQGWPGLVGKTGTADFLTAEYGTEVKPGLQLPAKLFGGVFTAANGKRYAVGAMALRVRQAGTRTLELSSSSAAEAALLMARALDAATEERSDSSQLKSSP